MKFQVEEVHLVGDWQSTFRGENEWYNMMGISQIDTAFEMMQYIKPMLIFNKPLEMYLII